MPDLAEGECRRQAMAARVGRLATVRPEGTPWVSPVCFAIEGNAVVTAVDTKPKATRALARLSNVRANPAAELVVDHYDDDDWTTLWWVRLTGPARVLGGDTAWAVELLCQKYAQYRAEPPNGPVLVLQVVRWSGWSFLPMTGAGR
jgi:PPOX class probable F420-dependent enzyme